MSKNVSDHEELEFEPIEGLPERPPPGEEILWQGKPRWSGIALRVFHVRKVLIYFSILVTWQGFAALWVGEGAKAALFAMLAVLPYALVGLAILAGLAYLYARTTVYTITSRRVVMRFGVALPMCVNFPFQKVESAALRLCSDGTGDIALTLRGPEKIAFLILWPLVRPGHYRNPLPMMRGLADAREAAAILATALRTEHGEGIVHALEGADEERPAAAQAEPALAMSAR